MSARPITPFEQQQGAVQEMAGTSSGLELQAAGLSLGDEEARGPPYWPYSTGRQGAISNDCSVCCRPPNIRREDAHGGWEQFRWFPLIQVHPWKLYHEKRHQRWQTSATCRGVTNRMEGAGLPTPFRGLLYFQWPKLVF